jgi:hypothetical protein
MRPQSSRNRLRLVFIAYCAVQSIMLLVWWAWLLSDSSAQAQFVPAGSPTSTLIAFAAPDVLVFFTASTATAIGLAKRYRWTVHAAAVHAGAAVYAALYAISLAILDASMWMNAILMCPAMIGPPAIFRFVLSERSA